MQELSININNLIEKYKECPNLHKLASFYHTSHIKLSNMLKDANYPIQRIGKARVLNEEEIQQAIEEYVNGMPMEEVSKKFHIRIKKLRGIFRDKGVQRLTKKHTVILTDNLQGYSNIVQRKNTRLSIL